MPIDDHQPASQAAVDLLARCRKSVSGELCAGYKTLSRVVAVVHLDVLHDGRDVRVARRVVLLVDGTALALYSLSKVDGGRTYDVPSTLWRYRDESYSLPGQRCKLGEH